MSVRPAATGLLLSGVLFLSISPAVLAERPRELTFEERVAAQTAIERVYHTHRIGTARPFAEVAPRAVVEAKVRTYLRQSVALDALWGRPVTGEMLQRELERMTRNTRLPLRLIELYTALDNDPFLIRECLARPILVDRLTRGLFAADARLHATARNTAEVIREGLIRGAIDPNDEHPLRKELEVVASDSVDLREPADSVRMEMTSREFARLRSRAPAVPGEIGDVTEGPDAFVVRVVLDEQSDRVVIASYSIYKTTWDQWWGEVGDDLDGGSVDAVAGSRDPLPMPSLPGTEAGAPPCEPDDTWRLMQAPDGRVDHTAIWTGSEMIVWGGGTLSVNTNTGGLYDPATDSWSATATTDAPEARHDHTAVWTGTEMIVWGGRRRVIPAQFLDTGGRYDPVTNSWIETSTTNVPLFRSLHTAVWTGSVMIVWGGSSGTAQNTGGRYNPSTNSWTATSTTGAPVGRVGHTVVWTGSRMIVWGGQDSGNAFLSSGGRYDPVANSWSATTATNAPAARRFPTSVWTGGEMIVWGGRDAVLAQLDTGARYDPVGNSWTATSLAGAPDPRVEHVAVWTGTEMVVWGGGVLYDTGGRYDPVGDSWTATPTIGAPSGRNQPTAVWTGSEMIVWGGWSGSGVLDTGGRYDPAADSWRAITASSPPDGRRSHTVVWTGTEMIVWGGHDDITTVNTGGRFDPATDSWTATTTTNAPASRWNHTAVWTGMEMIIWGGSTLSEPGSRYDPVANHWTTMTTTGAPPRRWLHTAVWTGTEMIVWGGGTTPLDTGGRYNPGGDSWTLTSTINAPMPRYEHAAVWTGTEMIVWGGRDGGTATDILDTGGRYHPATDTWTATSNTLAPVARTDHTAVWTGTEMIVWGGVGTSVGNTGGRYTPTTDSWTQTSTVNAPTARDNHTVVWTGNVMIVWGGERFVGTTEHLQTGGRFDPLANSWTATSTESTPSGRTRHSAIWTGSQMIAWGGRGENGITDSGGRYSLGHNDDDDGDGFTECAGDCDDVNSAVYPGASEICDGLRNDCDDPEWPLVPVDELDDDGDAVLVCEGDCDDSEGAVYPGASQVCDGLNNECGHPSWPSTIGTNEYDDDLDGLSECAGDCDDARVARYPGNTEVCDGLDNDCNSGTQDIDICPVLSCGCMDIALVIDDTGSMYAAVVDLQAGFAGLLATAQAASGGDLRMGLVTFKDTIEVDIPLTTDTAAVQTAVNGILVFGGAAEPEASDEALRTVIHGLAALDQPVGMQVGDFNDFRSGCQKIAILVTDARPGGFDNLFIPGVDDFNAGLRADEAAAAGVRIDSIFVENNPVYTTTIIPIMMDYATTTGGVFTYLPGPGYFTADSIDGALRNCGEPTGGCCTGTSCLLKRQSECAAAGGAYKGDGTVCSGTGFEGSDTDGDGFSECANDCAPVDPDTYPDAPEVNDGLDNQCPGNAGYGIVDEITGVTGFLNPLDDTEYSWPAQSGATAYQVARATAADFASGCTTFTSSAPLLSDSTPVPEAEKRFYLVRSLLPFPGSWGTNWAGAERIFTCGNETQCTDGIDNDLDGDTDCQDPDCLPDLACQPDVFSFTDTFADDIASTALLDFFAGISAGPTDYLFFEILKPTTGSSALCTARADFYRDNYILYAPTGGNLPSGFWEKWYRLPITGGTWVSDFSGYLNRFGAGCFVDYSWCPEWAGLSSNFFQVVHPAHPTPSCETVDSTVGCSDGTWKFTLKVGPSRLATCGF